MELRYNAFKTWSHLQCLRRLIIISKTEGNRLIIGCSNYYGISESKGILSTVQLMSFRPLRSAGLVET